MNTRSTSSTRQRDGAPLNDKLLSALAAHLNDDHRDDLLACAKALKGCHWADCAEIKRLEATGVDLEVSNESRVEFIRLDFPETAQGVLALKSILGGLIRDSRAQLGWSPASEQD
ncbi:MAG: DUF2470 domain-containing protein [Coleofasciculaceae cyanobacterium RL_1_1]|nr:DUF2470 domain-containing protein [Coleofasciculaceae cyanobacterium RL_1_1]